MKVEIQILDDQIELLNNIRSLPGVIKKIMGKLPQAFPGGNSELETIQDCFVNMEFNCKKMIFNTCIVRERFSDILNDTFLCKEEEKEDYY